jgi:multiple sugar transport system substrate-binding protein
MALPRPAQPGAARAAARKKQQIKQQLDPSDHDDRAVEGGYMTRHFFKIALGSALALAAAQMPAGAQGASDAKLTVWWVKGFYKSEDDALFEAIRKFEAKTGVKVDLSQYAVQDMIPKTVSALDAGTPPDVAYADVYDFQVAGKWAYDGKLEDISDIITPIKARFTPNTVETTLLYNDKAKKKAYYAFPLKQQTMHIEYWEDMLQNAGFKDGDIPKTWKEYGRSGATRRSPRCAERPANATTASACRWASPSWTPTTSSSSTIPR